MTGDVRQIEGIVASDVWSYYCQHMDLVKIVEWIDAQLSATPGSVAHWPFTEPVTGDMIAELHSCPARLTDYLLDRLAGYVTVGYMSVCCVSRCIDADDMPVFSL